MEKTMYAKLLAFVALLAGLLLARHCPSPAAPSRPGGRTTGRRLDEAPLPGYTKPSDRPCRRRPPSPRSP